MNELSSSRRRFLLGLATAIAAAPLMRSLEAEATAPHLAETDANATALGYVEDAAKAATKETSYEKGARCAACTLYQVSSAADGYAPCAAFPGKLVNANGWCRAFDAKA